MNAPGTGRTHVMHVLPRLTRDGTTHMVATLLKGMDRDRFRLTLCGLSAGDADLDVLRPLADDIHVLGMQRFWNPGAAILLARLARRLDVDVMHTHRIRPDLFGRLASAMARVPVNVSTQHYVEEWSERGVFVGFLVRHLFTATMGLCHSVACNSAAERDVMLRKMGARFRERTCVIHNGLDESQFVRPDNTTLAHLREQLSIDGDARIAVSVAYLTERKGHRYLLDAMPGLLREFPGLVLLLVGDGPEQQRLQGHADALGIGGAVRFLGRRSDVPALLSLAEIAVLPSLWEPFGLAALEAMALETPVVVSRSGGLVEFVRDGETGMVVPPADAEAIGAAMSRLLRDPDEARRMGANARHHVLGGFTARHVARAYESLYDRLLEERL